MSKSRKRCIFAINFLFIRDVFDKVKKNMVTLGKHSAQAHGYFTFPKPEGDISPYMIFRGKKLLNWSLNNYLGLANHPEVRKTDAESHACIIDGVHLHVGKHFVFKHNDIEDLEKQLTRAQKFTKETSGGILVLTEGVFGMRGDQGKLKEITELKNKYSFRLFVDDAHGIGTMGRTGGSTGQAQNCQDAIDIYFGTFAKSFALIGAFISSEKEIIKYWVWL